MKNSDTSVAKSDANQGSDPLTRGRHQTCHPKPLQTLKREDLSVCLSEESPVVAGFSGQGRVCGVRRQALWKLFGSLRRNRRSAGSVRSIQRRVSVGLVSVVARCADTREPAEAVPVKLGLDRECVGCPDPEVHPLPVWRRARMPVVKSGVPRREPSLHRSGWSSRRGFKVSPARLDEKLCACGEFGSGLSGARY